MPVIGHVEGGCDVPSVYYDRQGKRIPGDVWQCPECGDCWVLQKDNFFRERHWKKMTSEQQKQFLASERNKLNTSTEFED